MVLKDEATFGFGENPSYEKGIKELSEALGSQGEWFVNLIQRIKQILDTGRKITDVLIMENKPVRVGTLKMFYPAYVLFGGRDRYPELFAPSEAGIKHLVRVLSRRSDKDIVKGEKVDFSVAIYGFGVLRGNFSADINGTGIAFRYLDFTIPDFSMLGYPERYAEFLKSLVTKMKIGVGNRDLELGSVRSGGLILHVGETGSGKTTAIAGELGYIAQNTDGVIITYENPVEYRFLHLRAPVRQYEIGRHIADPEGNHFKAVVEHALRNAPSVIMIGECRTLEEMEHLIDIASRGHLIFSTIHANTVGEALRILMYSFDEGVRYKLAGSLVSIVAHRLLVNSKGQIVPLLEIFVPDRLARNAIYKGEYREIHRRFYIEKNSQVSLEKNTPSVTFTTYLHNYLKVKGLLTEEEIRRVEKELWFLFEDKRDRER